MIPNVLAIAGSDPSGGAGLQADLKTFGALRCYGMAVPTALTVQNTRGVFAIEPVAPAFVQAQIEAIFTDIRVNAVKIGMLATPETAIVVAECLRARQNVPVVLDPVLGSTSGTAFGGPAVARAICDMLAPLATVLTPNLAEAATLSGRPVANDAKEMEVTGKVLLGLGSRAVLVKGGHLAGSTVTDVLCTAADVVQFKAGKVATRNTHGTGCTLASAIAAFLAHGVPLRDAVSRAGHYVREAIAAADGLTVGMGIGPLDHFHGLHRT